MKFGPKIFLVLGAVIFVLIAQGVVLSSRRLGSAYEQQSRDAIDTASGVIAATLSERKSRSQLLVRALTQDARVRAGLTTRAGGEDPQHLGGGTPEERRKNADDYFDSFLDEYWVEDSDGLPEQDFLLLVGKDGTIAYGESGDAKRERLDDTVMGQRQVGKLVGALADQDKARMLWSGPRLRTEVPPIPGLHSGVYFAAASRVAYAASGIGGDESVGIAILGTHRLGLERVIPTGADAVFVDGDQTIESTFGMRDAGSAPELERAAAAWLHQNKASDAGLVAISLGDARYYAQPLQLDGLVKGPVAAGVFFSRAREQQAVDAAGFDQARNGLFAALLALGVAVFFARGLARPISEISAAAVKVAAGDLKVSVPANRKDQLGDLARRFNEMVQGLRERALAKDALGRYLSPEMAQDVVSGQGSITLTGQKRELTILFCDVAGFTTISEKLEPEALVALLNQYLDQMVKVLISHGAYVDKFEGDAIMAFWNAPRATADHAAHACLAILEMRAAARALSAQWKAQGQPEFGVRYGLNTGVAIVGNMGATDKVNYTAIGDNVNLGSRLEGANKQYGTELMIAGETYEQAKEKIEARELDMLKVKGKLIPVRVYELMARKGELTAEQVKLREGFAEGLKLYRARQFKEALARFEAAAGDGPSRTFSERCRHFLDQPPEADWDGTYEMETK